MLFLNVVSIEPLKDSERIIKISSKCLAKDIYVYSTTNDNHSHILKYLRFISQWVGTYSMIYDIQEYRASFLGTTSQIADFIREILNDFTYNAEGVFYLDDKDWRSFKISEDIYESRCAYIFILTQLS
jgi:hypothetical protein